MKLFNLIASYRFFSNLEADVNPSLCDPLSKLDEEAITIVNRSKHQVMGCNYPVTINDAFLTFQAVSW